MTGAQIIERIAKGRTDAVVDLLRLPDGGELVSSGSPSVLQWLVSYDDVTALKLVEREGADLAALDLDKSLGDAAFFGHWRTCDFLISRGADVNHHLPDTGERPLHSALCKAGVPYVVYVVRLLLERGADPNVATEPGRETGAFMRDVRTCGETPLHRAAAYADPDTIRLLLHYGASKEARDANGDTPLTWASRHLRPGIVLSLLCFGNHRINDRYREKATSDHGCGWGTGMAWNFLGEYLPESGG